MVLWTVGAVPRAGAVEAPVLLGIYPSHSFDNPAGLAEVQDIEAWLGTPGRRFAIAGEFMTLEAVTDVAQKLEAAWSNGYVPFVNLQTGQGTAGHATQNGSAMIADGALDSAITSKATAFAQWAKGGGGKRAFLAPLQEMNGNWIPYYTTNKAQYIAAYRRIRSLFEAALTAEGVTHKAINWVFAPNNGSAPGDEFELYYPGHDDVDVVAMSAYNYGGCPPVAPWFIWETFETGFKPYLDRLRAMAPGKALFLSQTGVLDKPAHGIGDKDEWFRDTFAKLAGYPRFRGLVYFNVVVDGNAHNLPNCPTADFRLHEPGTDTWQGFKDAATDPANPFGYWAPTSPEMRDIVFAPSPPRIFDDVIPSHPFAADTDEQDLSAWVNTLANAGITSGCSDAPPLFCPKSPVTREQMAVFLLRGMHGAGFVPPNPTGTVFSDVPLSNGFARWIERLAAEGITGGCGGGAPPPYCPGAVVTRAQMAVFLLRAKHGATYRPPAATGNVFTDIAGHQLADWIEQLAAEGVTGGCATNPARYCPDSGVTREQMAIFLVRAFSL